MDWWFAVVVSLFWLCISIVVDFGYGFPLLTEWVCESVWVFWLNHALLCGDFWSCKFLWFHLDYCWFSLVKLWVFRPCMCTVSDGAFAYIYWVDVGYVLWCFSCWPVLMICGLMDCFCLVGMLTGCGYFSVWLNPRGFGV
jgi:hypothetical protein